MTTSLGSYTEEASVSIGETRGYQSQPVEVTNRDCALFSSALENFNKVAMALIKCCACVEKVGVGCWRCKVCNWGKRKRDGNATRCEPQRLATCLCFIACHEAKYDVAKVLDVDFVL